jgi:hypothetical protein
MQKIMLIDDIDGSAEAVQTLTFLSVSGDTYQIDLSAEHLRDFTVALDPYLRAGRLVAKGKARKATAPIPDSGKRDNSRATAQHNKEIRTWALSRGFEVGPRGKIPEAVRAAYNDAHKEAAA